MSIRRAVLALLLCISPLFATGEEGTDPAKWKKPEFTGQPLAGLRVALDVGHYRLKPGAMSARGVPELSFNLATTRVIAGVLEKAGATVIVVNADGLVSSLAERPEIAAREKADVFISIHHDSVNDKYLRKWTHGGVERDYADNFRGYSVFTSSKNAKAGISRELALKVGAALYGSGLRPTLHHAEPIQGENRPLLDETTGVYEFSDLVVLKSASLPAILLECGVIIHREEEMMVQMPEYQDLIGHALVQALAEVFPAGKREKKGLMKLFGK
ncbi:MAG: N-acetylmuramoyl-L-alanine amidase [Verrucomicrobiales bacterium]|nr:N-acetylmuramoyl-L-alanine amidase [Verrucomicrobiales bacterium]